MKPRRHFAIAATLAALWLVAAGARERESAPAGERESEERQLAERYQANRMALYGLIDEATKLQTAYLESDDLAALEKGGAKWEARAGRFLRKNLAPLYASEFAKARYQGPDVPVGKDPKARTAYQRIEARKIALSGYLSELRKPD